MKPLRQQNRPVISHVPRVEPAPPEHAVKMDHFRDVRFARVSSRFLLMGAFPSLTGIQRAGVGAQRYNQCVRKVRLKPESAARKTAE